MLKLKYQYLDHLMQNQLVENLDAGKDWREKERVVAEDKVVI